MSHEQWDALPWWQARDYRRGWQAEGLIASPGEDGADDLSALGVNTRTVALPADDGDGWVVTDVV